MEQSLTGAAEAAVEEEVDRPLCMAELVTGLLGLLGVLLLIAGLGFWTVHPPGQADLCRVDTLGLQNNTETEINIKLGACNSLYTVVFDSLFLISLPFIGCGVLALVGCFFVYRGTHARNEEESPVFFRYAAMMDLAGGILVAIPSMIFPGVTAVVSAGLAPIHAYWIALMVGHVVINAANTSSADEHTAKVTEVYNNLYAGYCAASRTELCLGIGTFGLVALFWVFVVDLACSSARITCWKPDYERVKQGRGKGSQLMLWSRQFKGRKCPWSQDKSGAYAPAPQDA